MDFSKYKPTWNIVLAFTWIIHGDSRPWNFEEVLRFWEYVIFGNSTSPSSIQKPIEVQKEKKPIEFKNSKIEKSKQKS